MGRSLRTAVVGWGIGFVVAMLWGATANRVGNPQLSTALFTAALLGGAVVVLFLLVAIADQLLSHRAPRSAARQEAARVASGPSEIVATAPVNALPEAAPDPNRAAARIAELEARLALEEEQLHSAAEALAATDSVAALHADNARRIETVDPHAAEDEPVLRQQLLDAVASLVTTTGSRQHDTAHHVETLLDEAG